MGLRTTLLRLLRRHVMLRRRPDLVIGGPLLPYLMRWYVIPRNPVLNIYLHRFLRSDDDRALHDHPWVNASYLLEGSYTEHTIAAGGIHNRHERRAGAIVLRGPRAAHRIELNNVGPCTTLFITGPRMRDWGFHCPAGWVHWRRFTDPRDEGAIGRGCGE